MLYEPLSQLKSLYTRRINVCELIIGSEHDLQVTEGAFWSSDCCPTDGGPHRLQYNHGSRLSLLFKLFGRQLAPVMIPLLPLEAIKHNSPLCPHAWPLYQPDGLGTLLVATPCVSRAHRSLRHSAVSGGQQIYVVEIVSM